MPGRRSIVDERDDQELEYGGEGREKTRCFEHEDGGQVAATERVVSA